MSKNQFLSLDYVKISFKLISTKISFKIIIRKIHAYIDYSLTLNMKPVFSVGIFEVMIVL